MKGIHLQSISYSNHFSIFKVLTAEIHHLDVYIWCMKCKKKREGLHPSSVYLKWLVVSDLRAESRNIFRIPSYGSADDSFCVMCFICFNKDDPNMQN